MKWHAQSSILIQGIAHPLGIHYAPRMKSYGTRIVGGVSPGHGGEAIGDIPVFDLVEQARAAVGEIEISLIFVPPYQVLDAALEAIASDIRQLVIATAGVPPLDMIHLLEVARDRQTFVLGSGSQGFLIPEQFWLGSCEPAFYRPGSLGILSRSDRLTDAIAGLLSSQQWGQSQVLCLGTDPMTGANLEQGLQILEEDDGTEAIVLIGRPDGHDEIRAAEYIASTIEKPVIAYFPGSHTPLEPMRGDAAAIIANQLSHSRPAIRTPPPTLAAYKAVGIPVADRPIEIVQWLQAHLKPASSAAKASEQPAPASAKTDSNPPPPATPTARRSHPKLIPPPRRPSQSS